MGDRFWLSEAQVERLLPFFAKVRCRERVDDRQVLSSIIHVQRNRLMWKDSPAVDGRPKTLYNRWKRWSRMGVFARVLLELAAEGQDVETLMIDTTHLKARRSASSLRGHEGAWGGRGRLIGRTKGGLNSKLHIVADARSCPIRMFLPAGQTSDYIRARAMLSSLPFAKVLLADRAYDADWLRWALADSGIQPRIPNRKGRKTAVAHNPVLCRQRHRIENAFGRFKDWRRIATYYDRCADLFLSACALAAVVLF